AVALSADAEKAIIGGPFERAKLGAAWVFARGAEVENPIEEEHKEKGKRKEESPGGLLEQSIGTTPAGTTPPTGGVLAFTSAGTSCIFARVSRKIAVQSRGRMALRLVWSGRG